MNKFLINIKKQIKQDIKSTYYRGKYMTMTMLMINLIIYAIIMLNTVSLDSKYTFLISLSWFFIAIGTCLGCEKYWQNKNKNDLR